MIPAGARDRLVTIEALTETRDATTKVVRQSWALLTRVHMGITPAREGRLAERFSSGQLTSAFDTAWHMPYRIDMDPEIVDVPKARRLVFRGRTYDITQAEHEQRQRAIILRTRTSTRVTA